MLCMLQHIKACILLLIVSNIAVEFLTIDTDNNSFLKHAKLLKYLQSCSYALNSTGELHVVVSSPLILAFSSKQLGEANSLFHVMFHIYLPFSKETLAFYHDMEGFPYASSPPLPISVVHSALSLPVLKCRDGNWLWFSVHFRMQGDGALDYGKGSLGWPRFL